MRSVVLLLAVSLIALAVSCSGSGVNGAQLDSALRQASESGFGASWNMHCDSCNFYEHPTDPHSTATLGQLYFGSNFRADISSLDFFISFDLGEPSGLQGATPDCMYIWYDSSGDPIEED